MGRSRLLGVPVVRRHSGNGTISSVDRGSGGTEGRRRVTVQPVAVSAAPIVGGLYRVDTCLFSGQDPKPRRPAVVLALPPFGLTDVPMLTRTSDTRQNGIRHPANGALGLTKDGVFAFKFVRSVDERYFRVPSVVHYLGMLQPPYFSQILAWWEER